MALHPSREIGEDAPRTLYPTTATGRDRHRILPTKLLRPPWVLSAICSYWREVALGLPTLWSEISLVCLARHATVKRIAPHPVEGLIQSVSARRIPPLLENDVHARRGEKKGERGQEFPAEKRKQCQSGGGEGASEYDVAGLVAQLERSKNVPLKIAYMDSMSVGDSKPNPIHFSRAAEALSLLAAVSHRWVKATLYMGVGRYRELGIIAGNLPLLRWLSITVENHYPHLERMSGPQPFVEAPLLTSLRVAGFDGYWTISSGTPDDPLLRDSPPPGDSRTLFIWGFQKVLEACPSLRHLGLSAGAWMCQLIYCLKYDARYTILGAHLTSLRLDFTYFPADLSDQWEIIAMARSRHNLPPDSPCARLEQLTVEGGGTLGRDVGNAIQWLRAGGMGIVYISL
ncbi:hypothetical protein DFH06DRAFT_1130907 [Mycena polygramma]|nr:hypothetical protein DFH06DRAFT_1130907 [Mycena polygramma]